VMVGRRGRRDPAERALGTPPKAPRTRRAKRNESERWVEQADETMRQRAKARAAARAARKEQGQPDAGGPGPRARS